jgi:hypothetical protein
MEKREKLGTMDKILRELEDLKNSEISILKKVVQIEAENINLGAGLLDQKMPDLHQSSDEALETIESIIQDFTVYRNKFSADNKLEVIEEEPTKSVP